MIMPGMIQVMQAFNAPESTIATSLTLYILGGASLQLLLGPISDAYGRRSIMLLGAAAFCFFTLLIANAHSIDQFLTARFFQGTGLCFISVIGYATIQELFDEMDAVRLISIMANAAILAPLLGPLLGAIIIHYTSWRVIFIIIAICSLLVLWGLWVYMPESVHQGANNSKGAAKKSINVAIVMQNYKALFTNKTFCFSTLAIGIMGIPCISWIALSPIILITEGKLTTMHYGLWQLPVFSASIIGNLLLRQLTYRYSMTQLMYLGCASLAIGTSLMAILPYFYGNQYYFLLPGVIAYFFALSIMNAPLNRYCLFITPVSKGTASAVISLGVMTIGALGIEIANKYYSNHSNLSFGLYCNAVILLFLLCIGLAFWTDNSFGKNKSTEQII